MYYFRFEIPTNADGTRVSYSPGWHGTMPHCPKDVKVLLYNDKKGYGIAQTEDTFVPSEVKVIPEAEALALVKATKDEDGVYFGQKLADRWLPEALGVEMVDADDREQPDTTKATATAEKVITDSFLKFCPICHQIVARVLKYEDGACEVWQNGKCLIKGLKAVNLILSCPNGHKVKVILNG